MTRRAALPLAKLLRSAVANAKHNFHVADEQNLVVVEATVDEGPTLKRRRPRAMGRVFPIRKRTSHVWVALEAQAGPLLQDLRIRPTSPASIPESPSHPAGMMAEDASRKPAEAGKREERGARTKVATKPVEFVRRIFRRKVI